MKRLKQLQNLPDDTVYDIIDSPVGRLTLLASAKGLYSILWDNESDDDPFKKALSAFKQSPRQAIIVQTKKQLREYFQGKRQSFTVPLLLEGTPFQLQAWHALCKIPYAKTVSYAKQAEIVGDRKKARAVGMANGLNPIPIIVPCHRVIGSDGRLTGFGGGLDKKQILLSLEQRFVK